MTDNSIKVDFIQKDECNKYIIQLTYQEEENSPTNYTESKRQKMPQSRILGTIRFLVWVTNAISSFFVKWVNRFQ